MLKQFTLLLILLCAVAITEKLPDVEEKPILLSKPTQADLFMEKIAHIESGGKYNITNQFGMMGKYQFSPNTVRALGFNVSKKDFLTNPRLQDSVMFAYMKANHDELLTIIERYDGKVVNGIKITRAGILAGAHFAGSHGLRAFLRGTTVTSDANGTTIVQYMRHFSDFHLPQI